MNKILIDGRLVGVGDSMTRYCLETLKGILELDQENEYSLLIRPAGVKEVARYFNIRDLDIEKLIRNSELEIRNLRVCVLDIPHYSFTEQTKLLSYLNMKKYDLVHFINFNHPIFYRGKFIVTIHDLTQLGFDVNPIVKTAFYMTMKSAAKDSAKIIAVSKLTEKMIVDEFDIKKEKIEVVYHGIDHDKFHRELRNSNSEIREFKGKYGIKGNYLLYVGAWKKHKNILRMLKAFEASGKGKVEGGKDLLQLVLVGKIDESEPEVIAEIDRINKSLAPNSELPTPIITAGALDVRDPALPIAYAGALAYIIPSLAEGFGWPPLEAMACGTPVISSNYSCMPEILENAAFYFDPQDIKKMAEAIEKITTDSDLRANLTQKGLEQVKKYNWSDTAKQTFEAHKEALK